MDLANLKASFSKYFLLDQKLQDGKLAVKDVANDASFYQRHRRICSFLIPAFIVWILWWPYMATESAFDLFVGTTGSFQAPRWYTSLTMVFGATVAGATSEGGAAIAFPVLTLTMGVAPGIARDFSYLIQSCGMTAAAFSIWFMGIKCEWNSILWCSIGGLVGLVFGLEYVAPALTPAFNKMYFVCIWLAFAVSLYWINRLSGVRKVDAIEGWASDKDVVWKHEDSSVSLNKNAMVLTAFGILGGIFTSMSGSGLDICSFAVLTLLYRVDERVATPTSVILMAINTVLAYIYRMGVMGDFNQEAYNLFLVCAPIVCIMAPVGAVIATHFHSSVLAGLIYIVDVVQFIGALVIIKPWLHKDAGGKTDEPGLLCWTSALLLFGGAFFFTLLARYGVHILADEAEVKEAEKVLDVDVEMEIPESHDVLQTQAIAIEQKN